MIPLIDEFDLEELSMSTRIERERETQKKKKKPFKISNTHACIRSIQIQNFGWIINSQQTLVERPVEKVILFLVYFSLSFVQKFK